MQEIRSDGDAVTSEKNDGGRNADRSGANYECPACDKELTPGHIGNAWVCWTCGDLVVEGEVR
jgi:ribosomal protein L37AE/L43A